jgi:D-3-phosphoglycerate dehydrogenase
VSSVPITPRSFRQVPGRHLELLAEAGIEPRYPNLGRTLDEAEMRELVAGCRALLVGIDPVSEVVMAAGPLALVVKYGSGLDNVDLAAAERRGITIVTTPGANAPSVAELAVAFMFALARSVPFHHQAMLSGARTRRVGAELAGRRLGVLGYGAIGRLVAALGRGLGMRVAVHDPVAGEAAAADGFEVLGFEELLTCGVLTIHTPLNDATHHLIGRDQLAAMPAEGLLVNTARPEIVDGVALAEALESGRLAGAAFDDLGEDEAVNARLLACDRFIATPHCGAATTDSAVRTGTAAVQALIDHRDLWDEGASA